MRALAACAVVLAGCAQISGLDVLDVADGAADAAIAADSAIDALQANDAGNVVDAHSDASGIADAAKDAPKSDAATGPCIKPSDCGGNNTVCCETLVTSGETFMCTVDADTIACAAASACPTTVDFSCGKEIVRRCTVSSDCTEQSYTKCCTIPIDDASSRQVCLSSSLAPLLGGTCL